jgi:hypothetical protein
MGDRLKEDFCSIWSWQGINTQWVNGTYLNQQEKFEKLIGTGTRNMREFSETNFKS